jgi:hypothetical protein
VGEAVLFIHSPRVKLDMYTGKVSLDSITININNIDYEGKYEWKMLY